MAAHRCWLADMGIVLKISTTREEHFAGDVLEGAVEMEVTSVRKCPSLCRWTGNKPLLSVPNVADPSAASDMRTHIDRVAPVKSATDRTYADGGRGRSAEGCDFFSYNPLKNLRISEPTVPRS